MTEHLLKWSAQSKQSAIAYMASMACLMTIFISTMFKHTNGRFDWEIFQLGAIDIVLVSIVPAAFVRFSKVSKWYWSTSLGVVVGFIAAVVVVKIKTGV